MLIKSILSCRYIEAQAHHFLYRCCLDLFLNFAHQDATADEHIISSDVHTALFNQIFSYVQDHPDMPDCLEKLSNRINMTGAKLAQGFRQYFSIGLKPFLHMVRMMLAYNHLMTASSSLAIVAAATGYRHPDQMIRDLEHYYDCNILALRKSM
jgi:transcriptional regulator GlxA family with amidase domain